MSNEAQKYPAEVFPLDVDFSGIPTGETIDTGSSAVTAYDSDQIATGIVKVGSLAASGSKLFATVEGGTAGKVYRLEFKAVTNTGNTFVHNIQLRILTFKVLP